MRRRKLRPAFIVALVIEPYAQLVTGMNVEPTLQMRNHIRVTIITLSNKLRSIEGRRTLTSRRSITTSWRRMNLMKAFRCSKLIDHLARWVLLMAPNTPEGRLSSAGCPSIAWAQLR